jgi:hypothetical protein
MHRRHLVQHARGGVEQQREIERHRRGGEERNVLLHAILVDGEVSGVETGDEFLARIGDHHVERDEIDTGAEERCVLRRVARGLAGGGSGRGDVGCLRRKRLCVGVDG